MMAVKGKGTITGTYSFLTPEDVMDRRRGGGGAE